MEITHALQLTIQLTGLLLFAVDATFAGQAFQPPGSWSAVYAQVADTNTGASAESKPAPGGQDSVDELSSQATDPTASLMAVNFQMRQASHRRKSLR